MLGVALCTRKRSIAIFNNKKAPTFFVHRTAITLDIFPRKMMIRLVGRSVEKGKLLKWLDA